MDYIHDHCIFQFKNKLHNGSQTPEFQYQKRLTQNITTILNRKTPNGNILTKKEHNVAMFHVHVHAYEIRKREHMNNEQ
jgi:hypothetical protein